MLVVGVGAGREATRSPVCLLALVVEGVTVGVGDSVAGSAGQLSDSGSAAVPLLVGGVTLLADGVPLPPEAKGLVVISESCVPAGIGPLGLAGQDPGGVTGDVIPNGMVPGLPTANPPTNTAGLAPTY